MANKTLSDFPVLTNPDATSVVHVQKELVDYQVPLDTLTQYVTENAGYADLGNKIDGATEKTTPVDADMIGLMDSAASNILTKFSWANIKAKLKTYFDTLYPPVGGWVSSGLTLTYASADAPTFTATVPGDVTSVLSVGMKVKLTQTTVKYFIVTAIAYSSPNTTITMYGGTDYTLTADAISNVYYSTTSAPHGFPMNPAKWTVKYYDNTTRSQNTGAGDVSWYNLNTAKLSIPIGVWKVSYEVLFGGLYAAALVMTQVTLSKTNNSSDDADFNSASEGYYESIIPAKREKVLTVTSKTDYFLNTRAISTVTTIYNWNSHGTLFIRAVCAYL